MNLINDLIKPLLAIIATAIPGSQVAIAAGAAILNIIELIKAQTNQTTAEVLDHADITLDALEAKILRHLVELGVDQKSFVAPTPPP